MAVGAENNVIENNDNENTSALLDGSEVDVSTVAEAFDSPLQGKATSLDICMGQNQIDQDQEGSGTITVVVLTIERMIRKD